MKCLEIEPLIYLVKEGELSGKERADLDRHLSDCSNCRKLYESVIRMTVLIGQQTFTPAREHSGAENAEMILSTINRSKRGDVHRTRPIGLIFIIRAIAASLLLLLISTFIIQEASFQKSISGLQLHMHEVILYSGSDTRDADCVDVLKRKLKTRSMFTFPGDAELNFNRIDEEQLAQYVSQVCGSNSPDMNNIKKCCSRQD
jgi:hypothetical protein